MTKMSSSLGQTSIAFENRYLTRNNAIITIEWTVTLAISKDFMYAIGRNIQDVILKKQAEDVLKVKELAEANDKLKRKTGIVFCMINILIIRRLDLFFVTKLLLAQY